MFVKLAVLACVAACAVARPNWGGGWHGQKWTGPLADTVPAGVGHNGPGPAQFPAGVSPHACPNYPNCANPAVAATPGAAAHGAWNGAAAGAWNGAGAGAWNGGAGHAGAWNAGNNGAWNGDNGAYNGGHNGGYDSGEYTGDGDYHGEGLLESGAFGDHGNNGQWNGAGAWNGGAHAGAWNGAAAGHGHAAAVPAGVDPHACPNYPFCH